MVPKEPQLVVWCPWGRARPQSSHLVAVCRLSTNQPTTLPPNRSARQHRALQLSARHLSGVSDSVWPKLDSSFPLVLLSSWFLWEALSFFWCCRCTKHTRLFFFLKILFIYFRQMGREEERERNISVWLPLAPPNWGPGPQPRHVP